VVQLREKEIEAKLKKEVEKVGGLALKFISPGVAGVPDRIVLLPYKVIAFVELKAPGEQLRPLQLKRKKQLEKLGFKVYVIDTIQAFKLFLERKKTLEEVRERYRIIERQRMTIEDRIEQIKHLFIRKKRLKFSELLGGERTRQNVVLTFLSMLELIRQKAVKVRQNANFGEIVITVNEKEMAAKEGDNR
jgi:chromatin segregation and condensation protein Rec8/ScpA/Scc1 (kleisin family)